jgi:hypothetical protein
LDFYGLEVCIRPRVSVGKIVKLFLYNDSLHELMYSNIYVFEGQCVKNTIPAFIRIGAYFCIPESLYREIPQNVAFAVPPFRKISRPTVIVTFFQMNNQAD